MKKRILSLILAFAMAATLAPATALVGGNVAKAAPATAQPTFKVGTTDGGAEVAADGTATGTGTLTRGAAATKVYVELGTINATTIGDGGLTFSVSAGTGITVTADDADYSDGKVVYDISADGSAANTSTVTITATNDYATSSTYACTIIYTVSNMSATVNATNAVNGTLTDNSANTSGAFPGVTGTGTLLTITPANDSATITYASGYAGTNNLNFTYTLTADSNTMSSPVQPKVTVTRTGANQNNFNVTFSDVHAATYGDWRFDYTIAGAGYTTVTGSTIIKVAHTYKVTYDLGGGTPAAGVTGYTLDGGKYYTLIDVPATPGGVASHTTLTAAQVSKPGEVLVKFVDGAGNDVNPGQVFTNTIQGDMTLTAVYRKATERITFEGGTGLTPSPYITRNGRTDVRTAVVENVSVGSALDGNVLSRDGYTLIGWSLKPGATVAQYAPNAVLTSEMLLAATQNATAGFTQGANDAARKLYAVWQAKETTINFNINLPADGKVSAASQAMNPIKFNYGSAIENFPANTYAVDGYAFIGWSLDPADTPATVAAGTFAYTVAGTNVARAAYAAAGINGRSQNVTLNAIWQRGTNVVLYDAPVNQGPKVFNVISFTGAGGSKNIGGTTNLPAATNKIGSRVLRWVTADGDVYNVGATVASIGGNASLYPVYEANSYRVIYDPATNGGALVSGVASIVDFKLADFASLNTPVASRGNWVFTNWTVFDGAAQIYETTGGYTKTPNLSPVTFTTAFTSSKVVEIMDEFGVTTITLRANYIPKVDGARIPAITTAVYPYGTPLKNITRALEGDIMLTYKGTAATATDINTITSGGIGVGGAIKSVSWTTTPSFVQDDKRMVVYQFTGMVTPDGDDVSVVDGPFKVTASITVNAKAVSGPVALTIEDTVINLPAGANARDVLAALEGVKTVKVTADNNMTYTVNTNSGAGDWRNNTTLGDNNWGAFSGTPTVGDTDPHTFVFERSAALAYTGLNFIAGNDVPYVIVNIAGGTRNPVVNPTDPTDPTEVIKEELAKAQKLLDEGYALRVFNPIDGNHYYYTSITELETLLKIGCKHEVDRTAQFKASNAKTAKYDRAVYRLSTKNAGGAIHYTADAKERDNLVKLGWTWDKANYNAEGAIFYVSGSSDNAKIYRLRNGKMHHFALQKERDYLMSKNLGWVDETGNLAADKVWYNAN